MQPLDLNAEVRSTNDINNTITVTFCTENGSVVEQVLLTKGSAYGVLPTPTREGFHFDGWLTNSNPSIGSIIASNNIVPDWDHNLYASWSPNKNSDVIVTFHVDNNSVNMQMTLIMGSTYGILPTPIREGFHFDGWLTNSNPSIGSIIASNNIVPDWDHNLYASWSPNKNSDVIVTFHVDSNSVNMQMTLIMGSAYGILPTPIREGFHFDGWLTNSNPSIGSFITSESIVPDWDHTLYAAWSQ